MQAVKIVQALAVSGLLSGAAQAGVITSVGAFALSGARAPAG